MVAVVLVLLGAGSYVFIQHRSSTQSKNRFAAYQEVAKLQEEATYLVGAENNPVRQRLNLVLSQTLAKSMGNAERLNLARQGLDLIQAMNAQIDDIGSYGDQVSTAIAQMQVGELSSLSSSDLAREMLVLAKKRAAIISDIRGLSYRADFEVQKILERIVKENGALTKEHIDALNKQIPEVEEQFNKRTELYKQLEDISKQIDQKSAAIFASSWNSAW